MSASVEVSGSFHSGMGCSPPAQSNKQVNLTRTVTYIVMDWDYVSVPEVSQSCIKN